MDPDENLREQRDLRASIQASEDAEETPDFDDVWRLAELCTALDEWLSTGGFLPRAWKR